MALRVGCRKQPAIDLPIGPQKIDELIGQHDFDKWDMPKATLTVFTRGVELPTDNCLAGSINAVHRCRASCMSVESARSMSPLVGRSNIACPQRSIRRRGRISPQKHSSRPWICSRDYATVPLCRQPPPWGHQHRFGPSAELRFGLNSNHPSAHLR
jgi:hypothetical protein